MPSIRINKAKAIYSRLEIHKKICQKSTIKAEFLFRCNIPTALAAEWPAEAELFESENFHGIVPLMFTDNPAEGEVAFNADPASARRDVDRMNRALFQPELVSAEEALKVCKKPRAGEAVFAFKIANLEGLENPRRTKSGAPVGRPPAAGSSDTGSSASNPPPSKRLRAESPPSGSATKPLNSTNLVRSLLGEVFK